MGRSRGRPKKGQLADMTIKPPPDPVFGLPPPEELEEVESRNTLGSTNHEIQVRYLKWLPSEMIVEFAIMQYTWADGEWQQVARIDSCHPGVVHAHQLRRGDNDDQGHIRDLGQVSADGWEEVDRWYDQSLTLMEKDWREYLRKWEEGRRDR